MLMIRIFYEHFCYTVFTRQSGDKNVVVNLHAKYCEGGIALSG